MESYEKGRSTRQSLNNYLNWRQQNWDKGITDIINLGKFLWSVPGEIQRQTDDWVFNSLVNNEKYNRALLGLDDPESRVAKFTPIPKEVTSKAATPRTTPTTNLALSHEPLDALDAAIVLSGNAGKSSVSPPSKGGNVSKKPSSGSSTPPSLPKQNGNYLMFDPNHIFKSHQAEQSTKQKELDVEKQRLMNEAVLYQAEQQQRMEENARRNADINFQNSDNQLLYNTAAAQTGAQPPSAVPASSLPDQASEMFNSYGPILQQGLQNVGLDERSNAANLVKEAQIQASINNALINNQAKNTILEAQMEWNREKENMREENRIKDRALRTQQMAATARTNGARLAMSKQAENSKNIGKWEVNLEKELLYPGAKITDTSDPLMGGKTVTTQDLKGNPIQLLNGYGDRLDAATKNSLIKTVRIRAKEGIRNLGSKDAMTFANNIINTYKNNYNIMLGKGKSSEEREQLLDASIEAGLNAMAQDPNKRQFAQEMYELYFNGDGYLKDVIKHSLIYGKGE